MKHSEKDKLEQFFHNSLESYGENPSDDLWSEMENRIPAPPVLPTSFWKRYGLLLLLSLMVGLVSLVGFQKMKYAESLAGINKTIELQDQTIDEISKELAQVQNKFLEKSENGKTNENSEFKTEDISQQYIYNNTSKPTELKNDKNNSSFFKGTGELILENDNAVANIITNQDSAILETKSQEVIFPKEIIASENSTLIFKSTDEVKNIPSIFLLTNFDKKKMLDLPKEKHIEFNESKIRKKGFEFFGDFHQIYPTIKFEDAPNDFTNPINRESNYGILYSFPMHKNWEVQLGIGFGNSTRSVAIKNEFQYADSEFEISDNLVRTSYNLQLKTNYNSFLGFQSYVYNYRENDGADIQAGDSFTAEINTTKQQKYLMFPLYIKHYLNKKPSKLKWSFKMGVIQRFAYFENNIAQIKFTNFSHPRLAFSHTNIITISENQKRKYKTELVLGTGVEYLFAKNWILIIEPTFKQSTTLEGKITPRTFGIYTGVRWNFE